ncbi:hypothetical protein [Sinorhizobium medicae]|uniref:hypothetical protein n=1 Tax=Sinorhizobium medicae TaxID=110321 RepID=UPI000462A8D9|nr:hypothetical protein [Sinorhizobium medicae]RVQ76136.1 hypothetical protein CN244_06410 [Sinorhizobium medicae]
MMGFAFCFKSGEIRFLGGDDQIPQPALLFATGADADIRQVIVPEPSVIGLAVPLINLSRVARELERRLS